MSNYKQNHIVEVNKMVSSIDKEFVPYEEALELKELGFDEHCFGFYNSFGFNINTHVKNSDDLISIEDYLISIEFERIKYNLCTTPTFSQAFRWFREKHGYLSYIDIDNYSFYRYTIYKGKCISEAPFETYEEAELACLRKLIEIVKKKQ